MLIKNVTFGGQKFFLTETKFLQLLLYKSELLTDLAQILLGVFYIITVYM